MVTIGYPETVGSVGIRELRDKASAVIRRVAAGETIEVTDHGRPVARITRIEPLRGLEQLIAEGRARPSEGELLNFPARRRRKGERSLSDILDEMRRDER